MSRQTSNLEKFQWSRFIFLEFKDWWQQQESLIELKNKQNSTHPLQILLNPKTRQGRGWRGCLCRWITLAWTNWSVIWSNSLVIRPIGHTGWRGACEQITSWDHISRVLKGKLVSLLVSCLYRAVRFLTLKDLKLHTRISLYGYF